MSKKMRIDPAELGPFVLTAEKNNSFPPSVLGPIVAWALAYKNSREGSVWYRGENKDFSPMRNLNPSAFRVSSDIEGKCFNSFKFRYCSSEDVSKSEHATLAKIRHFGLPSRLLDWSESLLVAIFFACWGNEKDKDGYVYALDTFSLNSFVNNEWRQTDLIVTHADDSFFTKEIEARTMIINVDTPSDCVQMLQNLHYPDEDSSYSDDSDLSPPDSADDLQRYAFRSKCCYPIAIYAPRALARIEAQTGCFTLHGGKPGINGFEPKAIPSTYFSMYKIDASDKVALLEALKLCGINEMTLFPDDPSKLCY